ncbi:MAG: glycerol-3-phosphate acyltransferase [Planctomycetota bacterium]|jgi:glycerol-3-phosphate acyltransferase PlsY|nr:glycerol-3-phosphate acyltransferase [Planctomycetota bacterium]
MSFFLAAFIGYVLGCGNAAYYLVKWRRGVDLRVAHSGTGGATNAGRVGGKKFFVATMLLDALKGALAAAAGLWLGGEIFYGLAGVFGAALGHIYPAQLQFRGGKGLATTWGGMWLINRQIALTMSVVAVAAKVFDKKLAPRASTPSFVPVAGWLILSAYPLISFAVLGFDENSLLILALALTMLARQKSN